MKTDRLSISEYDVYDLDLVYNSSLRNGFRPYRESHRIMAKLWPPNMQPDQSIARGFMDTRALIAEYQYDLIGDAVREQTTHS